MIQISEVSAQLAEQSSNISTKLAAGLHDLMYNQMSFANFSSSGAWSGQQNLSLPDITGSMTMALTTYVTSIALTSSRYNANIWPFDNTPQAPALDRCKGDNAQTCKISTNATGGGNEIFLVDTKTSYIVGKHRDVAPTDLMREIVQEGWTTADMLFQGSLSCKTEGRANTNAVVVRDDGVLDASCASQMDVCYCDKIVFEGDNCRREKKNVEHPCFVTTIEGSCPIRRCKLEERG